MGFGLNPSTRSQRLAVTGKGLKYFLDDEERERARINRILDQLQADVSRQASAHKTTKSANGKAVSTEQELQNAKQLNNSSSVVSGPNQGPSKQGVFHKY